MDVMSPRCCGLDVQKREVVACVVTTAPDGTPRKAVRAFGTMTADILALADWLTAQEVTPVAMERTGVSWKPIGNLWRTVSPCCWSMPGTSRRCPDARPTCATASGRPTCCGMACSAAASSRTDRSANYGS